MKRAVVVSAEAAEKFDEVAAYLRDELKFSEEAARAYKERFFKFIRLLGVEVDYSLCRVKRWREAGYRCAVFERGWVIAYEVLPEGVVVRDLSHGKLLTE